MGEEKAWWRGGDGLEAARFLAVSKGACPIVIHSNNGEGVRRIPGKFELPGCDACTFLPVGERWIAEYWRLEAKEFLP